MPKSFSSLIRISAVVAAASGCSSSSTDNAGAENSGGASTAGGNATRGGNGSSGASTALGGATIAGGAANLGGATIVAGSTGLGGTQTLGGTSSLGGATIVAGSTSLGGTQLSGGTSSQGGALAVSGSSSLGGSMVAGGSAGKAGASSSSAGSGGKAQSTGGTAGAAGAHNATCPVPAGAEMPEASLPAGYCAWVFAEGLTSPRGMVADAQGQLVVIESGSAGAVTLLWDANGDRVNQATERMRIATTSGLNHGVAIFGGALYASTATTVYRWPYDGSHTALTNRQTVLSGLPSGGHSTRTLVFDGAGNLYVSIGSGSNLDTNSSRARVVRLDAAAAAAGNATLANVTVHADGTRNEVGLRFDGQGRLWGVENGSDNLNRTDLGGDIHIDNPAEELNLFNQPGAFYGYPYCWSEGSLPSSVGLGPGTQWAYPSVMNDGTHTDAWCRNTNNVKLPAATMQAHSAPLDLLFYLGGAFPDSMIGNALITFHGSWNRTPATGYKVVVVPFGSNGMPSGPATPLLESVATGDTGSGWTHRPVSLAMGKSGEVYVTSDADGLVMAIGHD